MDNIRHLKGNPRFLDVPETPDTGLGQAPIVDIGAYEFSDLGPPLTLEPVDPGLAGRVNTLRVAGATAGSDVYVLFGPAKDTPNMLRVFAMTVISDPNIPFEPESWEAEFGDG